MVKYYCDGYCIQKNPSDIGGGYTIVDENNQLIKTEQILKSNFTNNEAELLGVLETAKICNQGDIISTDSQIIIKWISGIKNKRHLENKSARKDLNHLKEEAYQLIKEKQINLIWQMRENNRAGWYNEDNFNS